MRVIAIFNTLSTGNIGLENFICQKITAAKLIIVTKQSRDVALANLNKMYPESRVPVLSLNLRTLCRMFYEIKEFLPAVIHAHHAKAAIFGTFLTLFGRSRFIITAHNNFNTYKFRHKLAFGMAFLFSDRIICNSEGTKVSLPWFVNRDKTSVIYNGVNFGMLDRVSMATILPRKKDGVVVIGTVCRMVKQKDLPTLLRGFVKAARRSETVLRLRLVGDGPERPQIDELIKQLGIIDSVELTGSISREDVYRNLIDMDVFIVSSRWEGFCNAMVEAAAAENAIIASNIDPLPEVIGYNNAMFFTVGDSDSLCESLLELVNNVNRRQLLAGRASCFVRERYSLESSSEQYQMVYDDLAIELYSRKQ